MDFTDRDTVSEDKLIHFLKNQVMIGRPKRVRNTGRQYKCRYEGYQQFLKTVAAEV
jgi:hypothetical protein